MEYRDKRILVGDTDVGKRMMIRIEELKKLIQAYQDGEIAERDASSAYKWYRISYVSGRRLRI